MQHNALDYRHNYPAHAQGNPLTTGQWVMIAAGAVAVGGLAYWGFAKMKQKDSEQPSAENNPGVRHYYPRAA